MPGRGSSSTVDLDEAVEALAPRVLRYAAARLGDRSLADEVAQDSLAALVRAWRSGRPPLSPEAFVFAIARRRAGRVIWRRRFWAPLDHAADARDNGQSPEAAAIARGEAAAMRQALARLSACDREALLMVALGELSMADAAAALGLSVSAVKMRVHRARARLAALIEDGHGRP